MPLSIPYHKLTLQRICYTIALCISTSKPSPKTEKRTCGSLIDFKGFMDLRYTVRGDVLRYSRSVGTVVLH
jgi:hypothetical protein